MQGVAGLVGPVQLGEPALHRRGDQLADRSVMPELDLPLYILTLLTALGCGL